MLRRTECSREFQNGLLSTSLSGSLRRLLFSISCGDLVKLLKVNLTILWGFSCDLLEFLTTRIVPLSPQQFFNYSLGFPTLILVPVVVSVCEPILQEDITLCVIFLSNLVGRCFSLCLYLSYQPIKELLILQSVIILLTVRMDSNSKFLLRGS